MKKKIVCLLLSLITVLSVIGNIPVFAIRSHEGILQYTDVKYTDWYYGSAKFCCLNGIITGYGNNYTFAPHEIMTRGMFVVMLARCVEADTSIYDGSSFTDCEADAWYTPSVEWAADMGYVLGIEDGTRFNPNGYLKREQASVIFARVLSEQGYDVTIQDDAISRFSDRDSISSWAVDGVAYCVSAGLIGYTSEYDKKLSPKVEFTRAQAATVYKRFLENYYYSYCEHNYSESTCTEPSSCINCGLINDMPLGHDCPILKCNEGSKCKNCGEYIANDPLHHNYKKATCTTAEYSTYCGDEKSGPTGHNFAEATCSAPKTCSVCGLIEGTKLGHNIVDHICTRCGYEYFKNEKQRVLYYMERKGKWDDDVLVYSFLKNEDSYITGSGFDIAHIQFLHEKTITL